MAEQVEEGSSSHKEEIFGLFSPSPAAGGGGKVAVK